jgi:hypothetical protein
VKRKAEEVYRTRTTSQPEQQINNANAKYKQLQAAPTNLCTLHRTQQQTKHTTKPHLIHKTSTR